MDLDDVNFLDIDVASYFLYFSDDIVLFGEFQQSNLN